MADDAYLLCDSHNVRKLVRQHLMRVDDDGGPGRPRNRPSPILILEGPPGSGKTAVLQGIADDLLRSVPFARFDFTPIPPAPGRRRKTVWEEVDDALTALVWELSQWRPVYGSLRFPRFAIAQLARRLNLDLNKPADDLRREVRAELERHRGLDTVRQVLQDAVTQAGVAAPGPLSWPVKTLGPYAVQRGIDLLVSRTTGRRVLLGRPLHWYCDQGPGNDIDTLVTLNRWTRAGADDTFRAQATQLMFAAFFADLRDDFQRGRRSGEWSFNGALFLENVSGTRGAEFLKELAVARARHRREVDDDGDPLTVVATGRTRVPLPGAEVVQILLRPLDLATVGDLAAARSWEGGDVRHFAARLHAFTDGHPASVKVLLDAAAGLGTADVELNTLLARQPDGKPDTHADVLLKRLLPDAQPDEIEDLTTLSAARDRDDAIRLARRANLVSDARHLTLRRDLWVADNAGGQLLRRLLLRRLADRDPDHRASWAIVHDALRRYCRDTRPSDTAGELYHALAVGDLAFVVPRLAELIATLPTGQWLELLASVTAAPRPPGDRPADEQVRELVARVPVPDEPVAALAHVVAGRWIVNDPTTPGKLNRLRRTIARNYDTMADLAKSPAKIQDEAERLREENDLWQ